MKLSYYIYYRVPAENAARARAAVGAMQRELFEAELGALAERHGLAALLAPGSARKREVFLDF